MVTRITPHQWTAAQERRFMFRIHRGEVFMQDLVEPSLECSMFWDLHAFGWCWEDADGEGRIVLSADATDAVEKWLKEMVL